MADVFISYSHINRNIADNICHHIEAKGITCWYAQRDGRAGQKWAGDIMRAIEDAKVFILVYTAEANHSDDVLKEVTLAGDEKCKIIKFVISPEKMNPDLAYHLSTVHWLEATSAPLDRKIKELVAAVQEILKEIEEEEGRAAVQVMTTETPEEILSPSKGAKSKGKKSLPKNKTVKSAPTPVKKEKKSSKSKIKDYLPLGIMLLVVVLILGAGLLFGNGGKGTEGGNTTVNSISSTDVFGNEAYKREEITSVVFKDNLKDMPKDAWQIDEKSEKEVMAWVEKTDAGNQLVLASEGKVSFEDCYGMFNNYTGLEEIRFNNAFDTSKVTDMGVMFQGCESLKKLDLSSFDTSMVTNMAYMFNHCYSLESIDLSSFDTGRVTSFSTMFQDCERLEEIELSTFDTTYVSNMSYMFRGCTSLRKLDVSHFNTSAVVDMKCMFYDCSRLQELDVRGFDTSRVTDMSTMFRGCKSLLSLDVSGFKTSTVMKMDAMFNDCTLVQNLDVSGFDTSRVIDMSFMFSGCTSLQEINLTNFDTSLVNDMHAMFQGCYSLLKLDVSSFDTSNVTDMSYMFNGCKNLMRLNVSGFDMSKVTDTKNMFSNAGITEEEAGLQR